MIRSTAGPGVIWPGPWIRSRRVRCVDSCAWCASWRGAVGRSARSSGSHASAGRVVSRGVRTAERSAVPLGARGAGADPAAGRRDRRRRRLRHRTAHRGAARTAAAGTRDRCRPVAEHAGPGRLAPRSAPRRAGRAGARRPRSLRARPRRGPRRQHGHVSLGARPRASVSRTVRGAAARGAAGRPVRREPHDPPRRTTYASIEKYSGSPSRSTTRAVAWLRSSTRCQNSRSSTPGNGARSFWL